MSDHHIALPSKPRVVSESGRSGTYEIDGLYPWLRIHARQLASSHYTLISAWLSGNSRENPGRIAHEFSTIEGVKEDVVTVSF
jgi:hypothetical protein